MIQNRFYGLEEDALDEDDSKEDSANLIKVITSIFMVVVCMTML